MSINKATSSRSLSQHVLLGWLAVLLLGSSAGWVATFGGAGGLIAVVAVVAVLFVPAMFANSRRRLVLFVVGLLLSAGTSSGISAIELGYAASLVPLSAVALVNLTRAYAVRSKLWKQLFQMALMIGAIVICAVLTGILRSGDLVLPLRLSIPYFTLVVGILVALDASGQITRRGALWLYIPVAILSAVSFAVFYIQARGLGGTIDTPTSWVLPSILVVGTGISAAVATIDEQMRLGVARWLLVALLVSAVLVTGTRTGVVLVAAASGLMIASRSIGMKAQRLRLLTGIGLAATASVVVLVTLGPQLVGPGFLMERVDSVFGIAQEGVSSDLSGASRVERYELGAQYALAHPILGNGIGNSYETPTGLLYYIDTPLMYFSTFGVLLGTFLVLSLIGIAVNCVRQAYEARLAWKVRFTVGQAAVWLLLTPFSVIVEDRGLPIAIAATISIAFAGTPSEPSNA